ncbi:MAG: hypothetical protein ABEJ70_05610 [Halobacteriaceae archaeon]
MAQAWNISHRIDLFVHRLKRYAYLSMVVVLPVLATAGAAATELYLLRHGEELGRAVSPPVPHWVVAAWGQTFGGLPPLAQTVLVGVGLLAVLVGTVTAALRYT